MVKPNPRTATPTYKIPFSESNVAGLLKLHISVLTPLIHILVYTVEYTGDPTL